MSTTLVNIVLAVLGTVILYLFYRAFIDFKRGIFIAHKLSSWTNIQELVEEVSLTFGSEFSKEMKLICDTINYLKSKGVVIVRLNHDGQSIINEAKSKYEVHTNSDLLKSLMESFDNKLEEILHQIEVTDTITREQFNQIIKESESTLVIMLLLSLQAEEDSAPYLEARLTHGGPSRDKKFSLKPRKLAYATVNT